jgi:tetratricopeptide (TPR) repeat protein
MSIVETLEETGAPQGTHESNALFNRALELVNRNRADQAKKQLEMALAICPRHATYLSLYGLCLAIESEDYAAARRICESAVRMNPKDPLSRVNLGRVHRLQGNNRAAYGEFLSAWKLDRRHPAPATELQRMGIRRPPMFRFLPRKHWLNVNAGKLRARLMRTKAYISS